MRFLGSVPAVGAVDLVVGAAHAAEVRLEQVYRSAIKISGSWFGVWGWGFRVWGFGFRVERTHSTRSTPLMQQRFDWNRYTDLRSTKPRFKNYGRVWVENVGRDDWELRPWH